MEKVSKNGLMGQNMKDHIIKIIGTEKANLHIRMGIYI